MMESEHKMKENHSENDGNDMKIAETEKLETNLQVEITTKTNSEVVAQDNMEEEEAQGVKAMNINSANGAKIVKVAKAHSENGAQNVKLAKSNAETVTQDAKETETHYEPDIKTKKSDVKSITQNIQSTNTNQAHVSKITHINSENDTKDMKVTESSSKNESQDGKITKNNARVIDEGIKTMDINSKSNTEITAQDVKSAMNNQATKPTNAINAAESVKVTETQSEISAQDVKSTKDNQANKPTNANSENNAAAGVKVTETQSEIVAQDVKATKDNQANKPTNASRNNAAEGMKVTETHSGHSVQVVRVTETHSYELDEHALQQILMKDEIKDLSVVVVSIAGVTRSGKSFLLNVFLKYLTASQSARDDGSWLSEDSAPLVGFKWRSGSERTTLGIVLWSEPFILMRPSGEKVAVFLQDTQGTFDSNSTVNDCSTIFALSTLISSVQIYNLFLNIQEDNLQFLQLFTDYGRMVKDQDSKAFQVLEFLVRDWQYPWEHPFGAVGGEQLLEQKLKILPNQSKEMQDMRKNIRSSFEKLSCFLMPHPGYEIFDPDYKGKISDIRIEFRTYAKELVTSLFSSEKLMPKTINGEKVKPRDLFNYFKTYMNVFKSNEIPTLTSIYQAMLNGNLLSMMNEASEVYKTGMDSECGPEQLSMPEDDVHILHLKYSDLARKTFASKKKMGTQQDADKYLDRLMVDLDILLPQFEQGNLAKTQALINKAKESYEKEIEIFGEIETLCVHPVDLLYIHDNGLDAALKTFDKGRKRITKKEDVKRTEFIKGLNTSQSTMLDQPNQRNNDLAVSKVHLQYVKRMMSKIESIVLQSEEKFESEHNDEKRQALEQFESMRSKPGKRDSQDFVHILLEDVYVDKLTKAITKSFTELTELNNRKNKLAVAAAVQEYDTYINKCLGYNFCCHNLYMKDTVLGGVRHVLEKNHPYELPRYNGVLKMPNAYDKMFDLKSFYEDCKDIMGNLIVKLLEKAAKLIARNDIQNNSNVTKALKLYTDTMYDRYHFWHSSSTTQTIHNETMEKAFQMFFNMRTDFTKSHADSEKRERMEDLLMGQYSDYYYETLNSEIWNHYKKEYFALSKKNQ